MQLKKDISGKIAQAVGGLLVATASHGADWSLDAAFMQYHEKDSENQDRITISIPAFTLTRSEAPDDFISLNWVYDALSGASPNGAPKATQTQSFPGFTTPAGYTPLDPRFKDQRTAVSLTLMKPLNRMNRIQLGGSISSESDYLSLSGDGTYQRDFNNKLSTLSLGLALTWDTIKPKGGTPEGLSSNSAQTTTSPSQGEFSGKHKTTLEAIVGWTQVLNRHTLLDFNYGLSYSQGYMTDPYKIIALVDSQDIPQSYIWEKRPGSRLKQTLTGRLVTAFGKNSWHLDYRYYQDSWGIQGQMLKTLYHYQMSEKLAWEPEVRYAVQTKADFYYHSLPQGKSLPEFASADFRLADMADTSYGLNAIYQVTPLWQVSGKVMKMVQKDANDQDGTFSQVNILTLSFGVHGQW